MILPIGHEESGTRRLPWVTFALMILCAVAFFLSGRAGLVAEEDWELSEDLMEALEYYMEHPYLELDPEFEKKVFPDSATKEEAQEYFREFLGAMAERPTSGALREREQAQLDQLIATAMKSFRDHPLMQWGLIPADFSPLALLTHMFLHAGWLHLIGNMLILYLAGPFIEDVWGRPLFLGFYLLAGLVAALIYIGFNPESTIPMIGASGAIAGVMGAFLVRYRNTKLRFFYMFTIFWRGTFSAPAWLMLPLWFGEQLFMAMLTQNLSDGAGGVAYWAHVGGFAFGFGVALVMKSQQVEERFIHKKIEGKVHRTLVDNTAVEQALEAQAQGQPEEAMKLLSAEVRRAPSNRDAVMALWGVAVELNRAAEAAPALLRSIQIELRDGDIELALEHWVELNQVLPNQEVDPRTLLRIARGLTERGLRDEAVVALRRALLGAGRSPDPTVPLKIAQLARHLDFNLARGAARLALTRTGVDPSAKAEAEALLAELNQSTYQSSVAVT